MYIRDYRVGRVTCIEKKLIKTHTTLLLPCRSISEQFSPRKVDFFVFFYIILSYLVTRFFLVLFV